MAIKRLCAKCNRVIDYGRRYCDQCQQVYDKQQVKRQQEYDRVKRDKDAKTFYNNRAWEMMRDNVLSMYNGLCAWSLIVEGKVVPADVVHHIVPLRDNLLRGLDVGNLIPLSSQAHSYVHTEYNKDLQSKRDMQSRLYQILEEYRDRYIPMGGM